MLKNIINNIKDRFKVRTPNVQGFTKPGSNVRGVVDFDPKNLQFSSAVNNANTSGAFLQYPSDTRDQEHYILIDIIERLRAPDGCPWDKEQTHESLLPYFLEEAYELIESVELNDWETLKEELGEG